MATPGGSAQDQERKLKELEERLSKIRSTSRELYNSTSRVFDEISSAVGKLADYQNGVLKLSADELANIKQQLEYDKKVAELHVTKLKNAKKLSVEQQALLDLYEEQLSNLQDQVDSVDELVAGAAKRAKEEKSVSGVLKKQGDLYESNLRTQIKSVMQTDLVAKGLKLAWQAASTLSTQISQTSKGLGLSYEASKAVTEQVRSMTEGTKFFTFKEAVETNIRLNESLGTSVIFSGQMLEESQKMVDLMGLSAEEQEKLAGMTILTGKQQNDITKEIGKQNKGILNNKQVLKDVLKIEGQLAAQYKNDPILIANAVTQARKLGMTLEQTKSVSNSLLDFESSIANELEAELLTGMDLNLEKARYLALQGKSAEAAQELMNNLGPNGLAKFQSMNVLQQEALAKSIGMSADDLGNALVKQKQLDALKSKGAYNEIQRLKEKGDAESLQKAEFLQKNVLAGNSLDLAKQQYDIETKANKNMQRFQDNLQKLISGPAMEGINAVLEGIANILSNPVVGKIIGIAGGVGVAVAGILAAKSLFNVMRNPFGKRGKGDGSSPENPLYVQNVGGLGAGDGGSFSGLAGKGLAGNLKRIGTAFQKGGVKGGLKSIGRVGAQALKGSKGLLKKIPLIGTAVGLGMNVMEHGFTGESLGRSLISGAGSFLGGALGSLIAPGAGTVAGGMAGGLAGDWLADKIFGDAEQAEDFIYRPGQKPLKFRKDDVIVGGTDPLRPQVVSSSQPGIPSPIVQATQTAVSQPITGSPGERSVAINDISTQELRAIRAVLEQILRKESVIEMDGVKVTKALTTGPSGYKLG